MWQRVAALKGINIPSEHLAEAESVLEALFAQVRKALDVDLSTTEPALTFRCDVRLSPGGIEER